MKYRNDGVYLLDQGFIITAAEIIKLLVAAAFVFTRGEFDIKRHSVHFAVPALLYVVANNIYMFALNFTTPPVWILLIQSRILFTALVYRFYLKREISNSRWLSLIALTLGIMLAQYSPDDLTTVSAKAIAISVVASLLSV